MTLIYSVHLTLCSDIRHIPVGLCLPEFNLDQLITAIIDVCAWFHFTELDEECTGVDAEMGLGIITKQWGTFEMSYLLSIIGLLIIICLIMDGYHSNHKDGVTDSVTSCFQTDSVKLCF